MEEFQQSDQRTRKLMTMHKALHPDMTYADSMCQEKNEEVDGKRTQQINAKRV